MRAAHHKQMSHMTNKVRHKTHHILTKSLFLFTWSVHGQRQLSSYMYLWIIYFNFTVHIWMTTEQVRVILLWIETSSKGRSPQYETIQTRKKFKEIIAQYKSIIMLVRRIAVVHINQYYYIKMRLYPNVNYKKRIPSEEEQKYVNSFFTIQ